MRTALANAAEKPPKRTERHDALGIFLGEWKAEGTAYGPPDDEGDDPRSNSFPWTSSHTCRWHTGEFFLIQDERAESNGTFDTLCIMGVDEATGKYFAQTFENHGYCRRYEMTVSGSTWKLSGQQERAVIEFSDDNRKQTIKWEWKPDQEWLPLCDRVAVRTE